MLINFSVELERKRQLGSSCSMLDDNIKIDIKYDVRVCDFDLCCSSRIHLPRFGDMIINFSVKYVGSNDLAEQLSASEGLC
jgi:hypothetical protein